MVVLAALPGMVNQLLVIGKIVNPGNFGATVNFLGFQLRKAGLVGFVTLFGITTRNSIMMVSHWQHLHEVEGLPWSPDLIFRGARERLAPVLMTAMVTALGLLPIAVSWGQPGSEIEGPMALVI